MLKTFFLFCAFSVLTLSSAFAQESLYDSTNVTILRSQAITIQRVFSLGIKNPDAKAGAASTLVNEIIGEASITPTRCLRGGCPVLPKLERSAFTFKSSVTDRTPSGELLAFSCRRAIETAKAGDMIILTGDVIELLKMEFVSPYASRAFDFARLTDCEVKKP